MKKCDECAPVNTFSNLNFVLFKLSTKLRRVIQLNKIGPISITFINGSTTIPLEVIQLLGEMGSNHAQSKGRLGIIPWIENTSPAL